LGLLSNLQQLDSSNNQLTDGLTNLILLTNLQYLNLSYNHLTTGIPSSLFMIADLSVLDLSHNELIGEIYSDFGSLGQFTWLSLGSNMLSGSVPNSLALLTKLTYLCLSSTRIEGAWGLNGLTVSLGTLTSLLHLDLSVNMWGEVTEHIIPLITSLVQLEYLDLSFNVKTVPGAVAIPTEIGLLTSLQTLYIKGCQYLQTSIPSELGLLTALQTLDLSDNSLGGSIPSEIGRLTSLTYLSLWDQYLTGTLPTQFGLLTNLNYLDVSGNQLTGSIPLQLAALPLSFCNVNSNPITCDTSYPTALMNCYQTNPPGQGCNCDQIYYGNNACLLCASGICVENEG